MPPIPRLGADIPPCDLLIVGGGINGAGAAREAASRGLRVLLVEAEDFGFGASSRSTKLVHGGLRYLEHGGFSLVAEALRERRTLCEVLAPHLTRPLPFLVPVYSGDARPGWLIRAGLVLYDLLAWRGGGLIHRHRWLGPDRVRFAAPGLAGKDLVGAGEYWDCQMDDARIVLENVLDARELGARTLNYCRLDALEPRPGGAVRGLLTDRESGTRHAVEARLAVVCVGAWTDRLLGPGPSASRRVHPTKGVHLVTRRLLDSHALLVPARDGRVFFVIPWELEGRPASLIGTTDTDYDGDPAGPRAEPADVEYLLAETSRVLPGARLGPTDVLASFAGLRPLTAPKPGVGNAAAPREHTFWEQPGVVCVTGGKFTTYRSLCQELVERAAARIGARLEPGTSARRPLPGAPRPGDAPAAELIRELETAGMAPEAARLAAGRYGRMARGLGFLLRERPELARPAETGQAETLAAAVWAARHEMALHLDDFYLRRTRLGLAVGPESAGAGAVAGAMGAELGWDRARLADERERLRRALRGGLPG